MFVGGEEVSCQWCRVGLVVSSISWDDREWMSERVSGKLK
jgi:hypothetical protein